MTKDYTLPLRLKRMRRNNVVRDLIRETHLCVQQLIAPIFVREHATEKKAINSMPGQFQLSLADLDNEIKTLFDLGIQAVLLFGIPAKKDCIGSQSWHDDGIIQQAIRRIKSICPQMLVIADACFCEYTSHGHCGVMDANHIDNDKTLDNLEKQALSYAKAGVDWIAPSGMADGMVQAIRRALDSHDYNEIAILSYAVKYASSFYGPFREAAEGSPQFGDRKTYQMDPANAMEGLREAMLDIREGADLLMVKPAMNYLDVIYRIKTHHPDVPLCAYQVSGEFSMIKHAAAANLIDEEQAMLESLIAIKRAGADCIITYFAKDVARVLG